MIDAAAGPVMNDESGLTLVEALVALAISSFVIVALGNVVWFVVGQQERLARSEADVRQATWFIQTIDRIVVEADPASVRLDLNGVSLTTTGAPLSLVRDRAVHITLPIGSRNGRQSLEMEADAGVSAEGQGQDRRQPLLSQLVSLSISIRAKDVWLKNWQGQGTMPSAIRFSWQRAGGELRNHIVYLRRRFIETECLRDPTLASCVGVR